MNLKILKFNNFFSFFLTFCFGFWFGCLVNNTSEIDTGPTIDAPVTLNKDNQHPNEHPSLLRNEKLAQVQKIDFEKHFISTIKNCLGHFCFSDKVVATNTSRVGILAPMSSGGAVFAQMMRNTGVSLDKSIEISWDTHVPAYGYGKNHGWSKIIRLVRRVIPHAYSLLVHNWALNKEENLNLFELQLQQLMRWHCRLNHVSAHTAMLTIFIDDIALRPEVELQKALTFIGYTPTRQEVLESVQHFQEDFSKDLAFPNSIDFEKTLDIPASIEAFASRAISREMKNTEDLSIWPCKTFKELDWESEGKLPIKAQELAADCTSKFVQCTVIHDLEGG